MPSPCPEGEGKIVEGDHPRRSRPSRKPRILQMHWMWKAFIISWHAWEVCIKGIEKQRAAALQREQPALPGAACMRTHGKQIRLYET